MSFAWFRWCLPTGLGKLVPMSTNEGPPPAGAERLKWYVLRRRKDELDLNQMEVWQAGGPSNTTLTKIENGHLETLERATARKLDTGLRWETGSARRVWEGGKPTPLVESPADDLAYLRRRIAESDALTPEQKALALAALDPPNPPPGEVGGHDRPAAM